MAKALKIPWVILVAGLMSLTSRGNLTAQEELQTPSQKTKEALDKFNAAPAAIGNALQGLKEAAAAKIQQSLGARRATDRDADSNDLSPAKGKARAPGNERSSPASQRDPFQPLTMKTKANSQQRENLSPLERFELSQLKVVGIVWDVKEPSAMIEDTAGLGYIVKVGTPIGSSEGRVKAIYRSEVVVEESYADSYGNKKKRDVSMKLPTE